MAGTEPVVEALELCIKAGLAAMLWGPPGVGKSDRVKELVEKHGWGLIDVRLSQRNPVDVRGIPRVDPWTERTRYYPPFEYPDPERDGPRGIWFLDELSNAPRDVQSAALELLLERKFDNYRIPDGWAVVAAGNRVSDRAGAYQLLTSLANRVVHLTVWSDLPPLEVSEEGVQKDADGWRQWAYGSGRIREEVVSFIAFRPDLVWKATGQAAFATPRTWEFVSRLLEASGGKPPGAALAGCVGTGPAHEFLAFLRARQEMPDPDDILAGEEVPPPPGDRPDLLWALCGALVARLVARKKKRKNFEPAIAAFVEWVRFLPAEFQALYFREAARANLGTEQSMQPYFREFARRNAEVFSVA